MMQNEGGATCFRLPQSTTHHMIQKGQKVYRYLSVAFWLYIAVAPVIEVIRWKHIRLCRVIILDDIWLKALQKQVICVSNQELEIKFIRFRQVEGLVTFIIGNYLTVECNFERQPNSRKAICYEILAGIVRVYAVMMLRVDRVMLEPQFRGADPIYMSLINNTLTLFLTTKGISQMLLLGTLCPHEMSV
ncbi:hypothetical protein PsorP6_010763 [Peronosclerospora sorghi]|uniref:Uncharacterized protein n=1 Tax=Peronosclerospora sorghi TaxID=230839 RepID=A0ACC0VW49_9STRA|nr:hypothetical protein PsorP6_010763 [Peronosclerospora sorghi]